MFKFFVDQVVRQYQDLKSDLKQEMQSMRGELKDRHQAIDHRLEKAEKHIAEIQGWKWYMAGAAAVAFGIAEVAIRTFDYFFYKK